MKRHTFAIDLLKYGITTENIIDVLRSKQELTIEDIRQISDTALKIDAATKIVHRQKWIETNNKQQTTKTKGN